MIESNLRRSEKKSLALHYFMLGFVAGIFLISLITVTLHSIL